MIEYLAAVRNKGHGVKESLFVLLYFFLKTAGVTAHLYVNGNDLVERKFDNIGERG